MAFFFFLSALRQVGRTLFPPAGVERSRRGLFFCRCPRVSCARACTWPARPHGGAASPPPPPPKPTPPSSPASWRMFLTLICVSQPTCSGLITVRPVLINIQVWRAPRCLCFITAERSVCRVRPPLPCSSSDSSHDYTVSTVVIHLLPKLRRRTLSFALRRASGRERGRVPAKRHVVPSTCAHVCAGATNKTS